jgi:hypothetical protein
LIGKPEGDYLGDMRRWGDIIKTGLKEVVGRAWIGLSWLREPSGSMKCREFLDSLRKHWLFKNGAASWTVVC